MGNKKLKPTTADNIYTVFHIVLIPVSLLITFMSAFGFANYPYDENRFLDILGNLGFWGGYSFSLVVILTFILRVENFNRGNYKKGRIIGVLWLVNLFFLILAFASSYIV